MNKTASVIIVIVIVIAIIAGLVYSNGRSSAPVTGTPNSAEGAPEGSIHNLPVPAGVGAARKQLAESLGIEENKILIVTAFDKEWSDSCLGLGGPAESCLTVITPGYEVTMQAGDRTYVYRTDASGAAVREVK